MRNGITPDAGCSWCASPGAAEANVVCVLLGTAGIRACATGADVRGGFWVTVPAMQLAAARRLVPG